VHLIVKGWGQEQRGAGAEGIRSRGGTASPSRPSDRAWSGVQLIVEDGGLGAGAEGGTGKGAERIRSRGGTASPPRSSERERPRAPTHRSTRAMHIANANSTRLLRLASSTYRDSELNGTATEHRTPHLPSSLRLLLAGKDFVAEAGASRKAVIRNLSACMFAFACSCV
jgi:hypothetical protein